MGCSRKCIHVLKVTNIVFVFILLTCVHQITNIFNLNSKIKNKLSPKELNYRLFNKFSTKYELESDLRSNYNESKDTDDRSNVTMCQIHRDDLNGREDIRTEVFTFQQLENIFKGHKRGRFKPKQCSAKNRIAIIIPYRNRENHLKQFLLNTLPKLERQMVDFTIYVVEQARGQSFNRGMMRNIGFHEASKRYPYDCYIFNDVNTVIEDDRNMYTCSSDDHLLRHLVSGFRHFNYSIPSRSTVGGIIAVTKKQMVEVNGYSNMFLWGGEEIDFFKRIVKRQLGLERTDYQDGFATTLSHRKDHPIKVPTKWRRITASSLEYDGINSVRYMVIWTEYRPLFVWIVVEADRSSMLKEFLKESKKRNEKQKA